MAINIDLVADVKDVIKGTDKIGDALEDMADQLTDVGKEGQKVEDKVSDAFKGMAKDAETAGDKLDDSVSDAFRKIGKEAKDSGKTVGKSMNDGTDAAKDGMNDLKSESASTAKESAASFDGSADSIIGSFQEIAANAFSGFGPAGAAAGLAMAIGVGMAVTAFQEGAEKATAMKEKAVDMVDKISEAGGDLSKLDLSDTIKEWGREVLEDNWVTFWADESSTKFQETAKDAKAYGISARDAIRGASGSADDSRKFLAATADEWQKLNDKVSQGQTVSELGLVTFDASAQAAMNQRNALSDLRGQAEENIKTTTDAIDIYGIESDALSGLTDSLTTNAVKVRDAAEAKEAAAEEEANLRSYVDGTTEAFKRNAAAIDKANDAIKGGITSELDYLDGVAALTVTLKENGKTVDLNTAKGRDNRRAILDQAGAIEDMATASVEAGGDVGEVTAKFNAQKDALVNQVTPAFGGSKEAARAYIEQILKTPASVKTDVKADTGPAEAAIRAMTDRKRTVSVVVSPDGSEVERYFRLNSGRKLYVDIAPRGGVGITD